jgi:hypothetical protein
MLPLGESDHGLRISTRFSHTQPGNCLSAHGTEERGRRSSIERGHSCKTPQAQAFPSASLDTLTPKFPYWPLAVITLGDAPAQPAVKGIHLIAERGEGFAVGRKINLPSQGHSEVNHSLDW